MWGYDSMDVSQYLEIFIDETKEHLQSLNEQLLILEKEPENAETINEIFRAAHTLKGMSGTMGYKRMQSLTHNMENVFSEIRNGKMSVTADIVNTLFDGLDALESYLQNICSSGDEGTEENVEIISKLDTFMKQGTGELSTAPKAAKAEVKQEVVQNDVAKEKFRNFKFADYESHAMEEAISSGQNVYGATVYIQESCLLKAARAFLVFKTLEGMGTIIKSEPEVQDIEDEKFEYDFSLILLTKDSIEEVRKAIMDVSEVDKAYISEIQKEEFVIPEVKEVVEEKKKEETSATEVPAAPVSAASAPTVTKEKE